MTIQGTLHKMIQGVRCRWTKAAVAGVLTTAFLSAVPVQAHAQVGFAVRFDQPRYAGDDRHGYWDHEREEHERAEAYARQQAWDRQQAREREQAWERQQSYLRQEAWARQQEYQRHEAWEHHDAYDHDRHDRDRDEGGDGDRWR